MELIYYCTVEDVSVADGELISFENYFGKDVNFKINALTEEERKNIKLLDTELEKYKLPGYKISYIIFLYFYTCRFNIDEYMSCDISNSIGYFLWFFNKELPLIQNKNQDFINLIKKINDKIGRLKNKKIFDPSDSQTNLKFYKFQDNFLSKFCKEKIATNLELNFEAMDLALNFKYSTRINPCILFNILNIDIKKIKKLESSRTECLSNDYLDFYELICNDKNISSILSEKEMVKYIKNNFMIKDSQPIESIGILLFIILLIGTYFLLNKKHMDIFKKKNTIKKIL